MLTVCIDCVQELLFLWPAHVLVTELRERIGSRRPGALEQEISILKESSQNNASPGAWIANGLVTPLPNHQPNGQQQTVEIIEREDLEPARDRSGLCNRGGMLENQRI